MTCTEWKANPVSKGIAIAKAYIYEPLNLTVAKETFPKEQVSEQLERFRKALSCAEEELDSLYQKLQKKHPDQAKIFVAHRELLEDEELLEETETSITEEYLLPESAVEQVFNQYAQILANVEDPLIAGRASDLLDVKRRLLRILLKREERRLDCFTEEAIVVAHDLLPSDTAMLDLEHVKGIITEAGGSNSHCAILARSFGLPAILGLSEATTVIPHGEKVILDALEGKVIVFYSKETEQFYKKKQQEYLEKRKIEQKFLNCPGETKDGKRVAIGINVGSNQFEASEKSYDFIGLFRTEFLYMESDHLPTEEEQFVVYKNILEKAKEKVVTLRTLDIGGDKTLPYMELPKEENPFLGVRALRLCQMHPDILKTQLRAALRASAYGTLQIMFPMVGSMEDITWAKHMVQEVKQELDAKGKVYDRTIKTGVMIEIPSIALLADMVAEEVDFASIGSNDLTQYVCAADRMNSHTENYYQSYSPAMARLLRFVFDSFEKKGKPISVCGEMAGNPQGAVWLTGLGARKLSMNYASIPAVKAELSRYEMKEMADVAQPCKEVRTEKEIKERIGM